MKKILLFVIVMLCITGISGQQLHVPSQYATIQAAIIAATTGDTVLVDPGIYYEQINFLGKKPLMVASKFLTTGDTSYINSTIIDGTQITSTDAGSIVTIKSDEDTTSILCGFTIRNGIKGTKYNLTPDVIRAGGAIYIENAGAKIIHNRITKNTLNTSAGGGTIAIGAGIATYFGTSDKWVVIENNRIDSNQCQSGSNQAGGAAITISYHSRINNNIITNNTVQGTGFVLTFGGGFFVGGDPAWTNELITYFSNNIISGNKITGANANSARGGGGSFQGVTTILTNNIIEGNQITSANTLGSGAGISYYGVKRGSVLRNNFFIANNCKGNGGGLHIDGDPAIASQDTALADGNYFIGNNSDYGGGAYIDFHTERFQNNVFIGNHALNWGGGLCDLNAVNGAIQGHMCYLTNNSFFENIADDMGGGIFSFRGKFMLLNNIFWNDSCGSGNGDEIGVSLSSDVILGFHGTGDTVEIAYCDVDPGKIRGPKKMTMGNISANPLFVADSLYIQEGSPCRNTATAQYLSTDNMTIVAPDHDILNDPRPWNLVPDMGAYEWDVINGITESSRERTVRNSPNPFSSFTTIYYHLQKPGQISIQILDMTGRVVDSQYLGYQNPGDQRINIDGREYVSGIYVYRILTGDNSLTGLMIKE